MTDHALTVSQISQLNLWQVLDREVSCPIFIAPFATACVAHPDGEMALAAAAGTYIY